MITVKDLSKSFGTKRAVDGISFTVERGEVLGFLGPNGAGKSTTMRMITGYTPPTSGSIQVGGHDILTNPIEARKLIGYLPENAPAYADMTVHSFLKFAAEIRGLSGQKVADSIQRVVELCFLENVLHQSIETLSKGYLHRTCFAQSIIHDPDILILDEPTDGLDPNQKHQVRNLIRKMGEKKAIIFSTHILEEVEAVCSRAIIIDRGKVVANGTPEELKQTAPNFGSVTIAVSGPSRGELESKLKGLSVAAGHEILSENGVIRAHIKPTESGRDGGLTQAIMEAASGNGWKLHELHTEEGRLDEVFRQITRPDTETPESK